jgi:hypothetical protein
MIPSLEDRRTADLFPPDPRDTPGEARLRASYNAGSNKLMADLDAALRLRTSPAESQRIRHLVRGKLREAGLMAMDAMFHALLADPTQSALLNEEPPHARR